MNEREYINAVLDEIKEKIEKCKDVQNVPYDDDYYSFCDGVNECLEIVNEYRKEQE